MNYLLKVIDYALMKGEVDSPQHMLEAIIQTIPEQEEKLITGAEVLRQEGMQQGMQQGIYQVAKNLLAEGLDISLVMKTTGLAPEVLAKLKKDLG